MKDYINYATSSPMRDGEEMRNFFNDTVKVCLCERCIAKEKANNQPIWVGKYTKGKKCYYCDSTDNALRECRIEL